MRLNWIIDIWPAQSGTKTKHGDLTNRNWDVKNGGWYLHNKKQDSNKEYGGSWQKLIIDKQIRGLYWNWGLNQQLWVCAV